MNQFIKAAAFLQHLFDQERLAEQAGRIIEAILAALLLPADAPYVIGDPTEIARPQAYKTDYVGKLKDRKTRGFWLLLLATPHGGRALPAAS